VSEAIVSVERSTIAKAAQSKDKPPKPVEIRSDRVQGLILRIQPSGARTFYVQVSRGHRVKIGPAGTYTLKQAEERAKAVLRDPEAALTAKTSALTLDQYITEHYADHATAKLKNGDKSVARVRAIWKPFLNKRMTDITASEVDRFRDKRVNAGLTPATVNRDVAALSGVLSHWVKHNKIAVHPLAELEALRVTDDEVIRYLHPDESKRLRLG